jgi:hypothetical protein
MLVLRLRDPSIRPLGFASFRLIATNDGEHVVLPYSNPRNPMTVFVDRA